MQVFSRQMASRSTNFLGFKMFSGTFIN